MVANDEYRRYKYLYEKSDDYIKMDKLKTDGLYWIFARNAHIGIWFEKTKGFVIRRKKFSAIYLFVEYHWDTYVKEEFPFATVKPFEYIEQAPFKIENYFEYKAAYWGGWGLKESKRRAKKELELLEYLHKKSDEYSYEDLLEKYAKI